MLESQACRTMRVCNVKHIHGLDLHTEQHLVEYSELSQTHWANSKQTPHQYSPPLWFSPTVFLESIIYIVLWETRSYFYSHTLTPHICGCYSNIKSDLTKRQGRVKYIALLQLTGYTLCLFFPTFVFALFVCASACIQTHNPLYFRY